MALNSYRGIFGSTHGRTYARHVLTPHRENTSPLTALAWNMGEPAETLSLSAIQMAAGEYAVPEIIVSIAHDLPDVMENRQRHSLKVEEAVEYGLDPRKQKDILFFWGAGEYNHLQTCEMTIREGWKNDHMRNRAQAHRFFFPAG